MTNKVLLGFILIILVFLAGIFFFFSRQKPSVRQSPQKVTTTAYPTAIVIRETKVELTKTGFSPQTVTIKRGEGILWVNSSDEKATINSADHPTHKKFPEINLGEFENYKTINHVFMKSGTYTYHNHYNPQQSGTIFVE